MDEFATLLSTTQPSIVIGSESWLHDSIANFEVFPPGYDAYRSDRNTQGGGVFILINELLQSGELSATFHHSESVWCKVRLNNGKCFALGSFYRSPSSTNPESFDELSRFLNTINCDFILGGDFNMPLVAWNNGKPVFSDSSSLSSSFSELITTNDLTQFVSECTRQGHSSASMLDLIFANSASLLHDVVVIPGISDHDCVVATYSNTSLKSAHKQPRKVYFYERGDYASLSRELCLFYPEFCEVAESLNIDELWSVFRDKLMNLVEEYIPSKLVTSRRCNDKPWVNKEIRTLISRKRRLYAAYLKNRKQSVSEQMRDISYKIKHSIKVKKEKYISSLDVAFKNNPKEFWKFIKVNNKEVNAIPNLLVNGEAVFDDYEKASSFNSYFKSVFSNTCANQLPVTPDLPYENMPMVTVTYNGVLKLLSNLRNNSAGGPDGIPTKVIKACPHEIANFLVVLFNKSLHSSSVPTQWKTAGVVPIHKSGPKHSIQNYRPISLTSVCCKTLEHIIYSAVMKHLQNNAFFSHAQHGFRSGLSCTTQLVEFCHDLFYSYDSGFQVDCIFLDFRKAFDTVPHDLLLYKLSSLCIHPAIVDWIKNYLSERTQHVMINGIRSTGITVTSGVPQGSVLGPLLFLIYINDIVQGLQCNVRLYADDCVIYRNIINERDIISLQIDLNTIQTWCSTWCMSLNGAKCQFISFTRKRLPVRSEYHLDDISLERVQHYKYLGVYFSENLSWTRHIEHVTLKASRMLNLIRRNFHQAPRSVKEQLYNTNVRPILEYACAAWDPDTFCLVNKLERIQNRAARFVSGNYNFKSSISLVKDNLGWKPLAQRRLATKLELFYRIYSDLTGINKSLYIFPPHFISTRCDHDCKVLETRCRTNVFQYSFFPHTSMHWNRLPKGIADCKTLSQFQSFLHSNFP